MSIIKRYQAALRHRTNPRYMTKDFIVPLYTGTEPDIVSETNIDPGMVVDPSRILPKNFTDDMPFVTDKNNPEQLELADGGRIELGEGGLSQRGRKIAKKSITVKVPPGVDTGLRLRVTGEGEAGAAGGPSGDLYVVLHVKESDRFQRDGLDLILVQPISMIQAALGCKVQIKALEGEHPVEVPGGTQYGHRITIAGAGVPHLRGVGRGDLHVEFDVKIPRKLTKEQRELLEKLSDISGEDAAGSGGFFQRIFGD